MLIMFKLTLIQSYPAVHIDYKLVQYSANVHVCLKLIIVPVLVICINIFAFEPNLKKKVFGGHMSFLAATGTPVFWWCVL